MTIFFTPDKCLPKDPTGWGFWLNSHYYEHEQMRVAALGLSPSIIVPKYDILRWRDEPELVQGWLVSHARMHQVLDQAANITGVDFSLVDFTDDEAFLDWQDDHAQDHASLRTFFGIS